MTKLNTDYFARCIAALEQAYRDNRNDTAHDYGASFADETLVLLPQFIVDARRLNEVIDNQPPD